MLFAGRHVREWGGGWDLNVQQRPMRDGGYWGPPLIHLRMSDAGPGGITLELTTGEALVLARHLAVMVDKLES